MCVWALGSVINDNLRRSSFGVIRSNTDLRVTRLEVKYTTSLQGGRTSSVASLH